MKIAVIGAGPAGPVLLFAVKKHDPRHEIHVYEQNPVGATYGWGVVFSDIALSFLQEADPAFYARVHRPSRTLRLHGSRPSR